MDADERSGRIVLPPRRPVQEPRLPVHVGHHDRFPACGDPPRDPLSQPIAALLTGSVEAEGGFDVQFVRTFVDQGDRTAGNPVVVRQNPQPGGQRFTQTAGARQSLADVEQRRQLQPFAWR